MTTSRDIDPESVPERRCEDDELGYEHPNARS
jgi:hypothetical protein